MGIISEMLSYPFMVRALIGGLLVSLCASLLGVSLVLKRYSMIGDGLSHVSFGSLSIALAAGWSPLKVSSPEHGKVKSDAAIAMISASALAIGIIVTSLTTGMTTDVSSYMFGSILAMSREDVQFAAVLSMVVLGLYLFCYNKVFAVTFDESFAKATGVNVSIAVLTAITIVIGMRMMGAMLISSLIIFPALTSMRVFKSFRGVVIASGILSLICFFGGMVLSYTYSTPAGASVVVVDLAAFLLFSLIQRGIAVTARK